MVKLPCHSCRSAEHTASSRQGKHHHHPTALCLLRERREQQATSVYHTACPWRCVLLQACTAGQVLTIPAAASVATSADMLLLASSADMTMLPVPDGLLRGYVCAMNVRCAAALGC